MRASKCASGKEPTCKARGQEDPLEEGLTQPPVFMPGESHRQKSLVGYSPREVAELDMID